MTDALNDAACTFDDDTGPFCGACANARADVTGETFDRSHAGTDDVCESCGYGLIDPCDDLDALADVITASRAAADAAWVAYENDSNDDTPPPSLDRLPTFAPIAANVYAKIRAAVTDRNTGAGKHRDHLSSLDDAAERMREALQLAGFWQPCPECHDTGRDAEGERCAYQCSER